MSDQKPNCSNCTKRKTLECPIQGEKEYYKIKEYITVPTVWEVITEVVGCLSHPYAREYLMADVIKELEQLSKAKWDASVKLHNVSFSYEGVGVDEAISLIKGGGDETTPCKI